MKIRLAIVFAFSCGLAFAQTNFRSATVTGNWNQSSSWQVESPNGSGNWISTGTFPTSASNKITILNGHTISATANVTIDQTTVQSGGVLVVEDGVVVSLNNAAPGDLTVAGTLTLLGESIIAGTGDLVVNGVLGVGSLNANGALVNGSTEGNVRVARTFGAASSIRFEGTGAQFIGNGQPTTASVVIDNNAGVALNNTTSGTVVLGNLTVLDGNLTVQNDNLSVNGASSAVLINGGNLIISSSTAIRNANINTLTVLNGEVQVVGGGFTNTLSVSGATTLGSGDLTVSSAAAVVAVNLESLSLTGGDLSLASGSADITLTISGAVSGDSFIQASGANSNIVVDGSGSISHPGPVGSSANIESLTMSRSGVSFPIGQSFTVQAVTINSGSVAVNTSQTISGNLNIASGASLSFNSNTLTLEGRFNNTLSGGTLSANASSTLSITGTNSLGTLAFSPATLGTLTLNRPTTGTLVTLNSALTISSALNLTDGVFNNVSGLNFSSGATVNLNSNASLSGAIPTGGAYHIVYSGAGLTTGPEARGTLGNVTNNCSGTVTIGAAMTVGGILTLNSGRLSNGSPFLAMGSGSSIVRNGTATLTGSVPSDGPYALTYNGTSYATGTELRGSLSTLTSNMSGTLTLSNPIAGTGLFTIASGTVTCGTQTVSMGSLSNAGVFNAPSTSLTLAGNIANSGTFNHNSGTVVFNGSSSITGTSPVFYNLTIQAAASFSAPSTLELKGNFTDGGTFTHNNGTVLLSGSVLQRLQGAATTTFNNIQVTNSVSPVSVTVNTSKNLLGTLTLGSNCVFDADGSSNNAIFTLLSTSDTGGGDANIGTIPASSSVTGSVRVQRFWSVADNVNRYFSTPVTSTTVAQLQNFFPITGTFTGTSAPCTGCDDNFFNLFWNNESVPGELYEGQVSLPTENGSTSQSMVPGRGYDLYMWNGVSPITINFTGTVNQGTHAFTATHTVSSPADPDSDGWNLLGNPYPSSIIWEDAGWTKSNIDPVVWVWDTKNADWVYYDASSNAGTLTNGVIATGQAFWVFANTGGSSLSVHESAKTNSSGAVYRQATRSLEGIEVAITDGKSNDKTMLAVSGQLKPVQQFDRLPQSVSIAILDTESKRLALYPVEGEPADEYKVVVRVQQAGALQMSFNSVGGNHFTDYELHDTYLGVIAPISGTYKFNVSKPGDITDRFILTRKTAPGKEISLRVVVYPNPVENILYLEAGGKDAIQEIVVMNSVGAFVSSVSTLEKEEYRTTCSIDMSGWAKGMYIVKVVGKDKRTVVHKVVKQ